MLLQGEELTMVLIMFHSEREVQTSDRTKINLVEGKYLKLFNKYIKSHYDFGFADFLILLGDGNRTNGGPLHYKIIESREETSLKMEN